MARILRIRNWAQFQHYKDRNPPWIKLHVAILASADWVMLDDASKLTAIVCMVVAAKHDGQVPDNPDYLKRVAYLKRAPNLNPLIECGFLEIVQADASVRKQVLAGDSTLQADARPEKETSSSKKSNKSETEHKEVCVAPEEARPKRATKLPSLFPMPLNFEAAEKYWLGKGRGDLCGETEEIADAFRDHHIANGTTSFDWAASWRTWYTKALKFNRKANGNGHGRRESQHEQRARIIAEDVADARSSHTSANQGADDRLSLALPYRPDD